MFRNGIVQWRTERRTERRKDAGENLTAGPIKWAENIREPGTAKGKMDPQKFD
jgi:hypothetical protein